MTSSYSLQRVFAWSTSAFIALAAFLVPAGSALAMPGQPDLAVHGIVNDSGSLAIKVGNQGTRSVTDHEASKTSLAIYVNDTLRYNYRLNQLNGAILEAGNAAIVTPFSFGGDYLPEGQVNEVRVCVDPDQEVSDADRDNNCLLRTFLNGREYNRQPDLTVHGIADANGTLSIKIGNQGDADVSISQSAQATVTIEIDGALRRTYLFSQLNPEFLKTGNATLLTPFAFGTDYLSNNRNHTVRVCVDATDRVKESNEENNCSEERLRHTEEEPPAEPDLAVTDIFRTTISGLEYVRIKLQNLSDVQVEMKDGNVYTFDVYVDDQLIYHYSWDTLSNLDFTKPWGMSLFSPLNENSPSLRSGGYHRIRACIDTSNSVAETTERNNCLEKKLILSAPQTEEPPKEETPQEDEPLTTNEHYFFMSIFSNPVAQTTANGREEVTVRVGDTVRFNRTIVTSRDLTYDGSWTWGHRVLDCQASESPLLLTLSCKVVGEGRVAVSSEVRPRGFQAVQSNVIYVKGLPKTPPPTLPPTSTIAVPPAGFEDEIVLATETTVNPFSDTSMNTAEGRAAATLYQNAIIGGYPDGTFGGRRAVNRAEAAKFLLLARYGAVGDFTNNGRFRDVLDGQWYVRFVVRAADLGIIQGYSDDTFRPGAQVNTAEFLKMMTLTFGLPTNLPYQFNDVDFNAWYAAYAGIASKYNLFPNRGNTLKPGALLTRNEVAVAIYQYLVNR